MPNTSAAKKAMRVSRRKQQINKVKKAKINAALKNFRKTIEAGGDKGAEALSQVFKALDKAVKTGYLKQGTVSRKKSRLNKTLKDLVTKA